MKPIISVGLLLLVTATIAGQNSSGSPTTKCTLSVAQSPQIRGLQLGSPVTKLLATFPEKENQSSIENAIKEAKKPANYGSARFDLRPTAETTNPNFENVPFMTVGILDERISNFHIQYSGPEWKTSDQFLAKLSEAFRLPAPNNWSGEDGFNRSLQCDGFAINAYVGGGSSSVSVRDLSATKTVSARREADKEKVRQAFKP